MIRLLQRRLIIPRGDTGSFTVPLLSQGNTDNIAVFTIFDELTRTRLFQKIIQCEGDAMNVAFTHNDTVNLKPGKYLWDIKFYQNPQFVDEELVNGDEVDSYYAGFSLPVCEIRETADNYLVSPDAPTAMLTPEQLDIITGAISSLNEAIEKTQSNVEHYPVVRNEVWYTWDAETQDYVSTGTRARGNIGPTGTGISSVVLNDDYTLTLNLTDGTSFTSTSIRGEVGNGIDDIVLNSDYTLSIRYTDGEVYTSPSIRGAVGPAGNGIVSIIKTNTVDNVDTYNINYTNGMFDSFNITNGRDGGVTSVAGKSGDVILNSGDIEYDKQEVYNSGTVGKEVGDLKSHLNELLPTNLIDSITDLNKYVSYNDGKLYNSTTANVTGYIDISNYTDLVYSQTNLPSSSSYWGIAFYDNDKVYISGVRCVRNAPSNFYTESDVNVPQNAKYIRMTVFHTSAVNGAEPYLYDKEDFDSSLPRRVQSAESELSILSTEFEGVKKDGCYTIPVDKWAVGGWLSYNSSDSRQYRVRCDEALEFDCDTFILADVGYKVSGYKLVNGSSVSLDNSTILKIPANTSVKIYARRFTEDTSEVVSNVTPFANAIKFSTALAPIELYQPTFTDVSMFERMGVGGDSYANGGGYISGIRSLTWGKNLERQAGITVDIYARSGEDVVGWNTDSTRGLPALLSGEECGLYWLQHGINGTGSAEAIGTPEDMFTSPHPSTFYGQYVEAIEQIKTTFPKARIVIATIIGSDWELAQNTQYSAVNTAVKNIAQYCEIPVIDISTDDFFRSLFYRNGIQSNHPSAMLCAGMAMAYRRLISKCIQENPSYFLEYGFTE